MGVHGGRAANPHCTRQVDEFWQLYVHMRRPQDDRPTVCDYHVFREGIRPMWEDERNINGGKWIVRLKKGVAQRYWEDILMAILGGQFRVGADEICGVVLSVRYNEDLLSIWCALSRAPAVRRAPTTCVLRAQEQIRRQPPRLRADQARHSPCDLRVRPGPRRASSLPAQGHDALRDGPARERSDGVQEAHRLDARQLVVPQHAVQLLAAAGAPPPPSTQAVAEFATTQSR